MRDKKYIMISVIIPVYNEENIIRNALEILPYSNNLEVIIADGGSSDKTVKFAEQYPVKVICCVKNRAAQMNEGANFAKGEILLFLHADCFLEAGSLEEIRCRLDKGYVGGCLSQRIDSKKIIYRSIEASGNIRARLSKVFYGDQAIFVRKDVFFRMGGFSDMKIFEDIIFSKRLKKQGRVCIINKRIYSSPRRWENKGILKATFINWIMTIGLLLGISPSALEKLYGDVR